MDKKALAQAASQVLALQPNIDLPDSPVAIPTKIKQENPSMLRADSIAYRRHKAAKKTRSDARVELETIPLDPKKLDRTCLEILKMEEIKSLIRTPGTKQIADQKASRSSSTLQLTMPKLFGSLCICDNDVNNYVIRLRSKFFSLGPRGIKVGPRFVSKQDDIDYQACFCELTPRPGPNRRPIFVLEYANTLISQKTNTPSLVLAAQMDVTKALQEFTTALIYERQRTKGERASVKGQTAIYLHPDATLQDSAVCLTGEAEVGVETPETQEFDWMTVDDSPPPSASIPQQAQISSHADNLLPANIKAPLASLVRHVQTQHERAFILSTGPSSAAEWQIAYTSSVLHSRPADLAVALSRTERAVLVKLGTALAGSDVVKLRVKWGRESEDLLLIAEPMMMGAKVGCWLCFLVD